MKMINTYIYRSTVYSSVINMRDQNTYFGLTSAVGLCCKLSHLLFGT